MVVFSTIKKNKQILLKKLWHQQFFCVRIISRKLEVSLMRDNIIYRCTECQNENYIGTKNKRNHPDRMEIKKFCPKCNKMTVHKEKK